MSGEVGGRVAVGRIVGAFGVRGWLRVKSYTSPPENIIRYAPWNVRRDGGDALMQVVTGRLHGDGVVVQLAGIADREAAEKLAGADIEVSRSRFAEPGDRQFFWADLEGMRVRTIGGTDLGHVDHLVETGANDVLVVSGERRRLIPFLYGTVVRDVDTAQRMITVDWDADF
jgi:16S rRNA processing protein RimM